MVLLAQHAASLPLYIGSIEGHPPPLVGIKRPHFENMKFLSFETHKSINFYIFKVGAIPKSSGEQIPIGHFVAVFVENVWILGEVKV
jgi:hypothetical protein